MAVQNNESIARYQAANQGDLAILGSGSLAFLCDNGKNMDCFWLLGCRLPIKTSLNCHGYPLLFENKFGSLPYSWKTKPNLLQGTKGQILNICDVKSQFSKAQKTLFIDKSFALSKSLALCLAAECIRKS